MSFVDMVDLPVPFQYFHLLNVSVLVNLFFLGYAYAMSGLLIGPVIFLVIEIAFMGMMVLSTELADPFGDDEVDFPINAWLTSFCNASISVLEERGVPDFAGKDWSGSLERERPVHLKSRGV